ncbi:MAG TPA: sigma-70 family RNA polymerase sigma factor [Pseudomonadota bacterium]|nr:sigma-70 family RNA polymerase sigma factor [Pseudomonadota bacterium]
MTSHFAIDVPSSLIERAAHGEMRAFEHIYRLFERPVYTLALRMLGDADEAQEILHDAMLQLFRKLGQFRGDAPFWGWLRQIAINEALMRLRRRGIVETVDEMPESVDCSTPSPEHQRDLERALSRLPPVTRSVVWLYHVEGYSHEEIAVSFGKSVSFSKSQLARGTQKLRALYAAPLVQVAYA